MEQIKLNKLNGQCQGKIGGESNRSVTGGQNLLTGRLNN
jgi:hypothetical protein